MGDKSEQKRQFIVETARRIFAEKGFAQVTMKDIIEACQISRGGIYLYFDSTASLFAEVLKQEEEAETFFPEELPEEATAVDLLLLFLREQKKKILRRKDNLAVAAYEYAFACKPAGPDNPLRRRFRAAVKVLAELIEAGVSDGEIFCEDPEAAAVGIMYLLEGLRISAHTTGLNEAKVDQQLLTIVQGLGIE